MYTTYYIKSIHIITVAFYLSFIEYVTTKECYDTKGKWTLHLHLFLGWYAFCHSKNIHGFTNIIASSSLAQCKTCKKWDDSPKTNAGFNKGWWSNAENSGGGRGCQKRKMMVYQLGKIKRAWNVTKVIKANANSTCHCFSSI